MSSINDMPMSPMDALPIELKAMILSQNPDFETLSSARLVSKGMNEAVEVVCKEILHSVGVQAADEGNFLRLKHLLELVKDIKSIPDDKNIPRNVRAVAAFFRKHVKGSTLTDLVATFKHPDFQKAIFKSSTIYEEREGRKYEIGKYNADIFNTFFRQHPAAADASTMIYRAIGDLDLAIASLEPASVQHLLANGPRVPKEKLMEFIKLMAKRHLPEVDYGKRATIFKEISEYAAKAKIPISEEAWEDIKYTGDIHCLIAFDPALLEPENLLPPVVDKCNSRIYGGIIHLATIANDTKLLADLLANMPGKIDDPCGQRANLTPLHIAAERGSLDALKFLIDSGADLAAKTKRGRTPLQVAVANGQLEVARYLIEEKGQHISTKTKADREHFEDILKGLKRTHEAAVTQRAVAANPLVQHEMFNELNDQYGEVLRLLSEDVGLRGKAILLKYQLPNATNELLNRDK